LAAVATAGLGLGVGKSDADAISLVRLALDLGVNFFDTAEAYGTEDVLGRALIGVSRERLVISSKSRILDPNGKPLPRDTVVSNLEQSLRRLGLERIDVFQLHAVQLKHYDYVLSELVPALQQQRQQGKIGHLGISETPPRDPEQAMLTRALDDSCWEVMMLAFHMMNQGPRDTIFPRTLARGIGTLLMFVVRNIFSRADALRDTIGQLVRKGELPEALQHESDPLGFLIHEGGASSLTDAAYRFARHEPGADVVLFGTGDQHHLRRNVESLLRPPLPVRDCDRLRSLFGRLRGVGLVSPEQTTTGIPLQSV